MSTAVASWYSDIGDLFPKTSISSGKSSFSRSNNCNEEKKNTFGQLPQLSMSFGQQQIGGGGALRRCASTCSPPPSPPSPSSFASSFDIIGSTTNGIHNNNNNNNNNNMLNSSSTSSGHRKLDRSMSEPVERAPPHGGRVQLAQIQQQQQQQQQQQSNSSRYKTELCRPFEESGTCKYGDKCQFAHGHHELRTLARHPKYKTELCRTFHTIGFCPYGPRCHFIHNKNESRKSSSSPPPVMSSSSTSSSTSSCNDNNMANRHNPPSRPKALSIGSFSPSLGSVGDSSPSSLSSIGDSPTGPFRYLEDSPFSPLNYPSNPATPVIGTMELARSVFSFGGSQELAVCPTPPLAIGITPSTSMVLGSCSSSTSSLSSSSSSSSSSCDGQRSNSMSSNGGHQHVTRKQQQFVRSQYHDADTFGGLSPPSPAGSLCSDLDSLSLSGSSPPTCVSPLDVSRGLPPAFFIGLGDV